MALREVKKYYHSMLGQYVGLKEDLKDFEQAFKDGYITEDRLTEVKEEFDRIKENYDRIAYIMYLFELPTNIKKQNKFKNRTKDIANYFETTAATEEAVKAENKTIISDIKERLKEITKEE